MKKRHMLWMLLLALMGVCFFPSQNAEAKKLMKKAKELQPNKTYRYDIDGDKKKETIRVVIKSNDTKYKTQGIMYVNNKKYYHFRSTGLWSTFVVTDFYAKKKGMNVFVYATSDSDVMDKVEVLKCGAKKAKAIARMKLGRYDMLKVYRMSGKITQCEEEGAFYLYPDSPFGLTYFGSNYVKVKFKIQGNKVELVKQKTYKNTYRFNYVLKRSMKIYASPDFNSEVTVLPSGTSLSVTHICPIRFDEMDGYVEQYSFVKIKTSSGQVGWAYDQPLTENEDYNPYFQEIPAWG